MILLAWVLKISTPKLQDAGVIRELVWSMPEMVNNAGLGFLPGWLVIGAVALFYISALATAFLPKESQNWCITTCMFEA